MAYVTKVSLDVTSHLGIFNAGFWLFMAAPMSQFAACTSQTPGTCVQQWDEKVSSRVL